MKTLAQLRKEYRQALCRGDRASIEKARLAYYSAVKAQWLKENKW